MMPTRGDTVQAITRLTGCLALQGELDSYPNLPNVGFIVRTSIPTGVPPIVRTHTLATAIRLRVKLLMREYLE